jgi:hypothetical protein
MAKEKMGTENMNKILEEIKAMESQKREDEKKLVPSIAAEEQVLFDAWWGQRSSRIPAAHRKEIIAADFRGRGLKDSETMASFDAALMQYGIKL